ncbi:hypothetical protein [Schlesneria paludicola]|uniref:hypothetical protein n=1 Tax=Schlesneria paludicola TaxID=360056 RepID=UPI00029A174A|nr:hypothetical protein [Schlesneria paludicola]
MTLDQWSERNASLNAFRAAIHRGTHGRIRNLEFDLMDDGSIFVCGLSRSYYDIQLALHATKQFGNKHRYFPKTRLSLRIGDKRLEFSIVHTEHDSPTIVNADCRSSPMVDDRCQLGTLDGSG